MSTGHPFLVELDLRPYIWQCNHCGRRVKLTDDPTEIFRHLALYCPSLPDSELAPTMHALKQSERLAPDDQQRLVAAHLIKHPEHDDGVTRFETPTQSKARKITVRRPWVLAD